MLQSFSVFPLVFLMPLFLGSHTGPKSIENQVLKIFGRDLSEIGAPGTPGMSHGTNFLVSKIFFYHKNMMLFYELFQFVLQKLDFI